MDNNNLHIPEQCEADDDDVQSVTNAERITSYFDMIEAQRKYIKMLEADTDNQLVRRIANKLGCGMPFDDADNWTVSAEKAMTLPLPFAQVIISYTREDNTNGYLIMMRDIGMSRKLTCKYEGTNNLPRSICIVWLTFFRDTKSEDMYP